MLEISIFFKLLLSCYHQKKTQHLLVVYDCCCIIPAYGRRATKAKANHVQITAVETYAQPMVLWKLVRVYVTQQAAQQAARQVVKTACSTFSATEAGPAQGSLHLSNSAPSKRGLQPCFVRRQTCSAYERSQARSSVACRYIKGQVWGLMKRDASPFTYIERRHPDCSERPQKVLLPVARISISSAM